MKTPFREIVVALVIGAVVGWFASARLAPERPRWDKGRMLERFSRDLDLTPAQKKEVAGIFTAKRAQLDAVREEMRPRFDAIRASSAREIRKLLDPVQAAKFEKIEAEAQARRQERRGRRSPR